MRWHLIALLAVLNVCISPTSANAQQLYATMVADGAFLIYEKPNIIMSGRKTRGIKTYLPVGTVSITTLKPTWVKNHKTKIPEKYHRVLTHTGISGLIRADLHEMLPSGKWLVATSENDITVLQPNKLEQRSRFSKRRGKYVRALEDPGPGREYIKVGLIWAKDKGVEDVGRIDAEYIADGSLVYIDTSTLSNFVNSTPSITPIYTATDIAGASAEELLGEAYEWLIDELGDSVGGDIGKLKTYLKNVALSPCSIALNAKGSIDGTFMGTGLRMEALLSLKEKGHVYHMDAYKPVGFESNLGKHFIVFRDITCKGSVPHRMDMMVVQGTMLDGLDVVLSTLPASISGKWDSNFQTEKFRSRMLTINGAGQYSKLFNYIQGQATEGTWLRRLKQHELNAFTAYLISMIAHFEKPIVP